MRLLQSDINSTGGLIGSFFVKCLNHLATVLAGNLKSSHSESSKMGKSSEAASSALLECEEALPLTSSEVQRETLVLYVTAALCEQLIEKVMEESPLPALAGACGAILGCHASCLEARERGNVRVSSGAECLSYGEVMMGGSLSISIVFGLVPAVLAGPRKVNDK